MFCVIYAGSLLNVSMNKALCTVRFAGMSNTYCPGILPSKGNVGSENIFVLPSTHYAFNMKFKFRYVFVYKKIILIITKHDLYKECFPDELNYLYCFNVYVQTAMALLIYFICFVSENVQEQLRDNICQELIFVIMI